MVSVKVKIKYDNGPKGMKSIPATIAVVVESKTESAVLAAIRKRHPGYVNIVIISMD